MKKCDDKTPCLHSLCTETHGVMRKNIIEYEFRRGNESRKIRFEVECTLEEFAEFLDVVEPFGDEWASRIGR